MAQRRMFSPDIVESDAFLDMPTSSQALYFHLWMYADDDWFVNPKRIMRIVWSSDDDIKVLLWKRFVLPFENGVVVIKHWRINNLIRKDWHRDTQYTDQLNSLTIKENWAYTEAVNEPLTNRQRSIVLCSVVKDREKQPLKIILEDQQLIEARWLDLLEEFEIYRWEQDKKWNERWTKEKTWDLERRLAKWKKNRDTNFWRNKSIDYTNLSNFTKWLEQNKYDEMKAILGITKFNEMRFQHRQSLVKK